MLAKREWAHLIPHAGAMCLLDVVVAWDPTQIHARSGGHRRPDHPLRRGGRLHAVHLAEFAAQATAVHGALCARAAGDTAPRPGLLVTLRDLRLTREYIDDLPGDLQVLAECLLADAGAAQYRFRVEHRGELLAAGRCAVLHPAGRGAY